MPQTLMRLVCRQVLIFLLFALRDCIGDSCVVGDSRWGGAFGVTVDLVALSHCSVKIIKLEDIEVCPEKKKIFLSWHSWGILLDI